MYLFNKKNSLRHQANIILTQKYPDFKKLSFVILLNKVKDFIFSREKWWVILTLVLIFYIVGVLINFETINLSFLNFISLKIESAKAIVDQRASNTATIISMTMAVAGFLLSNLAIKEPFGYKLLFKHSKLYSVIYFILIVIGSLIVISLLKDTIKSDFVYSRLAICATYLVLTVLFLIGYLFRSIIHFSNSKVIHDLMKNELFAQSKRHLYSNLTRKISRSEFENLMTKMEVKRYQFQDFASSDFKSFLVKDLNIRRIKKFITKNGSIQQLYFKPLSIESETTHFENYICFEENTDDARSKKFLRKSLCLAGLNKKADSLLESRAYFDAKIEQYVAEGKSKALDEVLMSYIEIYEIEMKNLF